MWNKDGHKLNYQKETWVMRLDSKIDECGLDCSYPNKINVSKGNT